MGQIKTQGNITIIDTTDIESIVVEYARNQSTSTPPTSGWSTTRPAWAQGYYIWQRTRIHKSGTQTSQDTYGDAVCLTGSTGQTGAAGRSLTSMVTQYTTAANSATITQSNMGQYTWTSNVPTYNSSTPAYWVRVTNTYSNPSSTEYVIYKDNGITDAMAIAATANSIAQHAQEDADGALGQASVSIKEIYRVWYRTDSATAPAKPTTHVTQTSNDVTKTWTKNKPIDNANNRYYFYCDETITNGGISSWTEPVLDTSNLSQYEVNALGAKLKNFWWDSNGAHAASGIGGNSVTENTVSTYGYNSLMGVTGFSIGYNAAKVIDLKTTPSPASLDMYQPPSISGTTVTQGAKTVSLSGNALTFYNPSTGNAQLIIGANGILQSGNFVYTSGTYSDSGTKIDLTNGSIYTPGFRTDGSNTYIRGEINALSGKIGNNNSNYWTIGNNYNYDQTASAALISHGTAFIQLDTSNTWRLSTDRIHTAWNGTDGSAALMFPKDGDTYWDWGIHSPHKTNNVWKDKFLYARKYINTSDDDFTNRDNLSNDLDDDMGYWTYQFYVDKNGSIYARNFYLLNADGTPGSNIGGQDAVYLLKSGGTITGNLEVNGTLTKGGKTVTYLTTTPTNGQILIADGTTGSIKTSGYTIATSVPSGALFTDKNVQTSQANTTKIYLTGTSTTGTATGTLNYDSNVYLTTTAGTLHATTFEGNLSGTASRATADGDGNTIKTTYLKLSGGQVTGPVSFGDSVSIDEATIGDLVVNGAASFTNGIRATSYNGGKPIYSVVGTQTATTASWTGNIEVDSLYDGLTIAYYLPRTSASNVTLNLTLSNGTTTGAVEVYYQGTTRMTTHYGAGAVIILTYYSAPTINGTTYGARWVGHGQYDTDSTGYYHRRIYPNLKAGANKIFPYTIIMQRSDGRWESIVTSSSTGTSKARNTSGFLLGHVLLMYANATYNENANVGTYNIWSAHSGLIDHRYSFNTANDSTNGTTGYKPIYLVGTVTNGLFYLDTKWWTQTLPTSADGKVYIYIGDAYDYYRMTFTEDKPIYCYTNGHLRLYGGDAATVNGLAVQTAVPSGAKFTDTVTTVSTTGSGNAVTSITASNGALTVTKGSTFLTSINSSMVTTALGYTPYNSTNPNGYTSNVGTITGVTAGTGLSGGGTSGSVTINHSNSVTAQTTQGIYPIKIDAQGHISAYGSAPTTLSGYGITDAKIANGVITLGSNTITPLTSQWTANLITGASATAKANAAATNGNVYLNLIENNTVRNTHKIVGSGTTTVTSDADGIITISSADSKTGTVTSITLTQGTGISIGSSGTAITTSGTRTIALADNYGDTKNPYASKTARYVLAAPANAAGAPSFRALTNADVGLGNVLNITQVTGIGQGADGKIRVYKGENTYEDIAVEIVATESSSVASAQKLTSYGGSTKQPVYFPNSGANAGKPVAISYTIETSVPSGAVFTDTTYTFTGGTNSFTVTPLNGTAQTVAVTPSITNNVTGSGTSGYLAKFNGANTITNGPQLGSSTTTFLRNDGTWATPSGAVTGVKGNSESSYRTGQVNITKANIGLGNVDNTADANKNVLTATKFSSDRTIALTGDVSGSASSNGENGWSIATSVADDSHNHTVDTILPKIAKTYTDVIGTANSWSGATFFYGSVRPSSWDTVWRIKYRIKVYVPNHPDYCQMADVMISGKQGDLRSYYSLNTIGSYYVCYYHELYRLKQAGFTNGYGHSIGVRFYSAYNPTDNNYKRTIEIEIFETENCTFSFYDSCLPYASISGTGSTNYNTYSEMDFVNNGLQETGDANDVNYYNRTYYASRTTKNALYRYQVCVTDSTGQIIPINSVNNSVATNKTLMTDAFDPLGEIFYWSSTSSYSAGGIVGNGGLYRQVLADLRYSFNCGGYDVDSTLTARLPLYLVATPQSDGTAKLYSSPLSQTLPTSDNGLIYIYLGRVYEDTKPYRVVLSLHHPVYWYKDGAVRQYIQRAENASIATKLSNTPNNTTTFLRGDNTWSNSLSGSISISKAGECGLEVNNTQATNPNQVAFIVGSSGNGGIYSRKHNKWIVYSDASGNVVLNGNASTATAFSSNASVTLTGDTTGTASSTKGWSITTKTDRLSTVGDNRAVATTPNDYANKLIFQGLKKNSDFGSPSTDNYSYVLGLRGWSDNGGGDAHELAFNNSGIFRRQGATTTWDNWLKLLDSGNYTDYTVTKTGTGASGTWGISISGNAATASKLGSSNVGAADRPIYLSAGTATQTTYRMAATNVTATIALGIDTNLNTGIWYVNEINSTNLYGHSDGAAIVNKYSDSWISQIYQDYYTGQIALRGKNNGTWQAWRKVLDSSNYTSYMGNYLTYNTNEGITSKKVFGAGTSYGSVTNKSTYTEKANINYDSALEAIVFSFA